MKKMKFRSHRGSLMESMETLVVLEPTMEALLNHSAWPFSEYKLDPSTLRMKFQGSDSRIGWDESWLVYFEGHGVVGMLDGVPEDAPETAFTDDNPRTPGTTRFRPQYGNFQRSINETRTIPSTTSDLMELIRNKLNTTISPDMIKVRSRKDDRRLGWFDVWSIEVEGHGLIGFMDGRPVDLPHSWIVEKYDTTLHLNDTVKVAAFDLPAAPAGKNAYVIDPVRSGVGLSAGWDAMFESGKEVLDEVVLYNRNTGQRVLLKFEALVKM